jgi:predicted nucleic-acid-binding protein
MIGLDTNIVVRYLTQDDPVQSPKATELIERRLRTDNPGFVRIVAMAKIAWVLERIYGLRAEELATAIERILQVDVLVIESEQEVFAAMTALQQGLGSFADALIGALGTRAGCSHTMTFDEEALRIPTFKPV